MLLRSVGMGLLAVTLVPALARAAYEYRYLEGEKFVILIPFPITGQLTTYDLQPITSVAYSFSV